ncbi:MAG: RluA family pseudouridine synthase [Lentisphaerae bacterium]|nr:RluA family pseudouridine synthase [Lentisphaerota bacterium]
MSMMRTELTADIPAARLDVFLHGRLPGLSRARIQALIRAGRVTVDGLPESPGRKVRRGTRIVVDMPPPVPADPQPEPIPLDVLYEDRDVVVVNKPAGLVVHPAPGHASGTLVNALLYHCRDLGGVGGERRPGIVHRLDKDTSGVLVAAKHDAALQALAAQFKGGAVEKVYRALVYGQPDPPAGRVETWVGRSVHNRKKMAAEPLHRTGRRRVAGPGRRALSIYRVTETLGPCSLLEVRIETGRTHQIRVHLAHIGHPVVGDSRYGRRRTEGVPAPRQLLHAAELAFRHPRSGARVAFRAPIPADFRAVVDALRQEGKTIREKEHDHTHTS